MLIGVELLGAGYRGHIGAVLTIGGAVYARWDHKCAILKAEPRLGC